MPHPSSQAVTPRRSGRSTGSRYASQALSQLPRNVMRVAARHAPAITRQAAGFARNLLRRGMRRYQAKKTAGGLTRGTSAAVNPTDLQYRVININLAKSTKGKANKKQLKGMWTYQQSHSATVSQNAGLQSAGTMFNMMLPGQINTSTGSTYNVSQNYTALQSLNPYLTNTGSNLLPSVVKPATDKFFVKSIEVDLDITSYVACAQEIELYVSLCKKTSSGDPIGYWSTGLVDQGFTLGNIAVPVTVVGAAGVPTVTTPGVRYSDQVLAKDFWSTKHHCQIALQGGASEKIRIKIPWNKLVKMETVNNAGGVYLSGYTLVVWQVSKGQLAYDTAVALKVPIYSNVNWGWCAQVRYKMGPVAGDAGRLRSNYIATNMPVDATASNVRFADTYTNTAAQPAVVA